MTDIRLAYRRPPERVDIFEQRLLATEHGCHVTLLPAATLSEPMTIDGRVVLENGAPIIWFTFERAWHDIGRFHNAAGEFTGYYANIIHPVDFRSGRDWECTDLFLDVWLGAGSPDARVLDEDEFEKARENRWIDDATAERARIELGQILAGAKAGTWPPEVAKLWTLEGLL